MFKCCLCDTEILGEVYIDGNQFLCWYCVTGIQIERKRESG